MKNSPGKFDSTAWQYELQLALEDPALAAFDGPGAPGPEAAAAAYRVAECLGYCRLLGAELPDELDGIMPAAEAMAAAEELKRRSSCLIEEAQSLPARWDDAPLGLEEELCADLLQACMDGWAAFIAISEAHDDCVEQREPAREKFDRTIDQLMDALDRVDKALKDPEVLALLSTLAGSQLLENWRRMLRIPEGDYLPWWLDGTLEREDQRIAAAILQEGPPAKGAGKAAGELLSRPAILPRHRAAAIWEVQSIVALAAAPSQEGPPVPIILKWASPEGRWIARLSCLRRLPVGGHLPLEFLTPAGQPACELAGQPVWLAGQAATIAAEGLAKFEFQQLREAIHDPSQPLTLIVGEERVEWGAI